MEVRENIIREYKLTDEIKLPSEYRILGIFLKEDTIYLIVLIDELNELCETEFKLIRSERPFVSTGWNYISSIEVHGMLWHL